MSAPLWAHDGLHDPAQMRIDAPADKGKPYGPRQWLAGDHHIHSEFSADYEADPQNPTAIPRPLFGKDGRYSIRKNAEMARSFGLRWMVSTDHGGPDHARINHDIAYPSLLASRKAVPEVIQFFGMEFDTPDGDHSSLIIPTSTQERSQLREIEQGWSRRNAYPEDPSRDNPAKMIAALKAMGAQRLPPVLFANHPSRSAASLSDYGRYDPAEFRDWNDAAPHVAVGMEGAPGHQAGALRPDGSLDPEGKRGGYRRVPTMGGFDPMTARLGGLWDSLLGEGRRWWITATSDSHVHWRDGGKDFWPGEYAKTYVYARANPKDILHGLRHGRIFVTTGDLVSEARVQVRSSQGRAVADIGGMLGIRPGSTLTIEISVRDPAAPNAAGQDATLKRIDLIIGDVKPASPDRRADTNASTRVVKRFDSATWEKKGDRITVRYQLKDVRAPLYLRVRGTNGDETEPQPDLAGEDPWSDLWFYTNPIFVELK